MYSIILNSNNRVNKGNTNENDCEYNMDWGVLQDGKYKLTYSISKKFIIPLTPFQTLIATKIPWAMYKGSSYNSTLQIIPDESGTGRHAVCSGINLVSSPIGNRNSVPLNVVSGLKSSSSNIIFPAGSIPSANTICCLTRYTNPLVQGRLLAGNGAANNYNFGAYRGQQPTIYEGSSNLEGCNNNAGLTFQSLNWINACTIRGNTILAPNQVLINKIASGTNYLNSTTIGQLAINSNTDGNDNGDFEMAVVIIWDNYLTASELVIVSNAIENNGNIKLANANSLFLSIGIV